MLGIRAEVMRGSGATAKRSASNMDEGQVLKKTRHDILSSAFFTARHDSRCFHRVLAGVSVANGKRGHTP